MVPGDQVAGVPGEVSCQVTVPLPRQLVYEAVADLASYPQWMQDVRRVVDLDDRRSRWLLAAPDGPVAWDVEVTVERAPHMFAWCARGPDVVGTTRMRLDALEGRTRIRASRFVAHAGAERCWWGQGDGLRGDLERFVAGLRRRVRGRRAAGGSAPGQDRPLPRQQAFGRRATASRT